MSEFEMHPFRVHNTKNYIGDKRFLPVICCSKNRSNLCIYCLAKADSREHLPSKCFLKKPYPNNLIVAPACTQCNNSFSKNEQYVSRLIKWISAVYSNDSKDTPKSFEQYKSVNIGDIRFTEKDTIKIKDIIYKLARGHLLYDCNTFLEKENCNASFILSFQCSQELKAQFDKNTYHLSKFLPEIGSRDFGHLSFIKDKIVIPWKVIQEGSYRYLISPDGYLLIVISECLYIQVEFD